MSFPKIELHVHLEGTVRARTLPQLARRNAFAIGRDGGLASVPHAGEVAGAASIRGAAHDVLGADRLRHTAELAKDDG